MAIADEDEAPFTVGKLFFQLNDTDGDLGIHAKIDGDPWRRLIIEGPGERKLLSIGTRGRLRRQGLTELSFESAEPNFDDLSAEQFFRRFPEGEYEVEGVTLDGQELESEIDIGHVMPAPADNIVISGVPGVEDCDPDTAPVVDEPVILSWDPVTRSHPEVGRDGPVHIVRYEVAVEREAPDGDPLTLTYDLPASSTEIEIPAGVAALGEVFKYQVLATDIGGNETSTEGCFRLSGR